VKLVSEVLLPRGVLVAPPREGARQIELAIELLDLLEPDLAGDVSAFTRRVVFFSGTNVGSVSDFATPGTIGVHRSRADDFVHLSESLYHEAVHQKLFALYFGSLRYGSFYDLPALRAAMPLFYPSWRPDGGATPWTIERMVGACHYYLHAVPFYCLLATRVEPVAIRKVELARRRARELLLSVHERRALLTPFGQELMAWMGSAADAQRISGGATSWLQQAPPPPEPRTSPMQMRQSLRGLLELHAGAVTPPARRDKRER